MFRPNAGYSHDARGIRMRLARPSAFIFALIMAGLIWAAVWHMSPEVSTGRPVVNGPVPALDRVSSAARFRCDSLFAKDCFEMFHRQASNVTTVPFMPVFDRSDLAGAGGIESDGCLSDVSHRGDRCLMRDNR
jgi:hypothetical protein